MYFSSMHRLRWYCYRRSSARGLQLQLHWAKMAMAAK